MANESYSVYPDGIDGYASLPLRRDGIHEIVAADHNRLRDAIVKIEQELGVQPSGTFATVAARLDNIGDAHALIVAHMADPTDAHDASAISVLDTDDLFFETDVEGALEELAVLLPDAPDELGEDNSRVPNDSIPSFFDGYGTKFVYNTSSSDSIHKKTQPSAIAGIRGIHIVEVGEGCDDGYALLRMSGGIGSRVLEFFAPGDVDYGTPVSIEVSEGTPVKVESYDTTKKIIVTRNSTVLSYADAVEEGFEIYRASFQPGYFSLPSAGFQFTEHISRTATAPDGVSRLQCMIGGTIFPADRGTLVLQRKTRGVDESAGTAHGGGHWPVAVLNLSANFDETKRTTGQPIYVPGMTLFDTITLYERHPLKEDYEDVASNADNSNPYDNYENDYARMQLAKYVIPISNSDLVGGEIFTLDDTTDVESDDKMSGFRILHYKEGITLFTGDPLPSEVYGQHDPSLPTDHDTNTTIRFSNIYFDDSPSRPGIELLNLRPQYPDARLPANEGTIDHKFLSGVKYYHSPADRFDVELRSDNNVFNKTYVVENILTFKTDVFDFPNGTEDGKWGASVDINELTDDGYFKWGSGNLPDHEDQTYYIVDKSTLINGVATNSGRRLRVAPDRFSNHSWIQATMHDPFGPSDGYDAYGAESIHRILVNSYSTTRATDTIEYFTDESNRILDTMVFDAVIDDLTPGDGYTLAPYEPTSVLPATSLQVGGRFTDDEFNISGLIYPQQDYYNIVSRVRPTQQSNSGMDYSLLQGHRQYQRLFSLGYPINTGRIRIVSDGNYPISFEDIRHGNLDRFGKIEIKVPGHGTNSTEWLDISRLFTTGEYEDGYGSMYNVTTGSVGDFTAPFTFGPVNTADDHSYPISYAIAVRVTYFGETTEQIQASRQKIMTMIQLLP